MDNCFADLSISISSFRVYINSLFSNVNEPEPLEISKIISPSGFLINIKILITSILAKSFSDKLKSILIFSSDLFLKLFFLLIHF